MLPAVLRPLRPCAIAASGVPFRYGTCVARTSSLVGTYQRAGAVTSTFLAPLARLERATRCLEGSRSIQLSYRGFTPILTCRGPPLVLGASNATNTVPRRGLRAHP